MDIMFLDFLCDVVDFLFTRGPDRYSNPREPLKGTYELQNVEATVVKIKPASQYKSNGDKIRSGYIHIYKIDGKDRLFKDATMFPEPQFEIGQTVRGCIQIFNNDIDVQKTGLFFVNEWKK